MSSKLIKNNYYSVPSVGSVAITSYQLQPFFCKTNPNLTIRDEG